MNDGWVESLQNTGDYRPNNQEGTCEVFQQPTDCGIMELCAARLLVFFLSTWWYKNTVMQPEEREKRVAAEVPEAMEPLPPLRCDWRWMKTCRGLDQDRRVVRLGKTIKTMA